MSYAKQYIFEKDKQSLFLPTPQISVAKNPLSMSMYTTIDNLSWRLHSINDVLNQTIYQEPDYYKFSLDVYFNIFESLLIKEGIDAINNSEFWNLPDLRLELCKVDNKNKTKWRTDNVKNFIPHTNTPVTLNSNQNNNIRTSIIHSISLSDTKPPATSKTNTIYSGGEGAYDKTEWGVNFLKVNKGKNSSFKIEIDITKYFRTTYDDYSGNYGDVFLPIYSPNMSTPFGHTLITRGVGTSPPRNFIKYKYYLRNQVLFFRLSCGKEGSFNVDKNRYDDRIYSDISIPIYIQPKVRTFYNIANDINSGSEPIIYHYKIGLGNKV